MTGAACERAPHASARVHPGITETVPVPWYNDPMGDTGASWPEWVIRQGFTCVWVRAPDRRSAVEIVARKLAGTTRWKIGPGVDQEVFGAEEYRRHARKGDYARAVMLDGGPEPDDG